MCHRFLTNPNFLLLLLAIDQDIAEKVRADGCHCGGRLHVANFPRKPRGGPNGPGAKLHLRMSFCCDADNCRRRRTPPSTRFLDHRVYLGIIVVLITALHQGTRPKSYARLQRTFGVDRRTIARWQKWWTVSFPSSDFWKIARARFVRLPEPLELPRTLVRLFRPPSTGMIGLLRFLSPIGTSERFQLQVF